MSGARERLVEACVADLWREDRRRISWGGRSLVPQVVGANLDVFLRNPDDLIALLVETHGIVPISDLIFDAERGWLRRPALREDTDQ